MSLPFSHKSILIDLDKNVQRVADSGDEDRSPARSIDRALRYFQGKRKKWRPIDIERIYFLALPIMRHVPKLRDPFQVSARALTYHITKRIENLATREKRTEIPLRIPGAVSLAATKAIGSNTHLISITIIIIRFAAIRSSRFDFSARYAENSSPLIRRMRRSRCCLYRFPALILLHAIGCRK